MPLDFNTLGSQNLPNSKSHRYTLVLMLVCLTLGLASVLLSLYTIKNIKDPEPVSIECSPFLLEKIEKQAKLFEDIAKAGSVKK